MEVKANPILVTLTSQTCSGKSHLLNHIRSSGFACLVSTTTRRPRKGEEEGVDYYFISDEQSREIEARDGFAELMTYNGYRYGVTKEEFHDKLSTGLAFLIVEPKGIDHYVKPALDVGASHLKFFVFAPQEVRVARFKERLKKDLSGVLLAETSGTPLMEQLKYQRAEDTVMVHLNRLVAMLTTESNWQNLADWDEVLDGTDTPEQNLRNILDTVKRRQEEN